MPKLQLLKEPGFVCDVLSLFSLHFNKQKFLSCLPNSTEQQKEEIAEYQEYTQTDEFVEDVAREKLGLVHDDEIVFIKEED